MIISPDAVGLMMAVFIACAVEVVEAFTIVLAMGVSRGWRSAFADTAAALATLAFHPCSPSASAAAASTPRHLPELYWLSR